LIIIINLTHFSNKKIEPIKLMIGSEVYYLIFAAISFAICLRP